MGGINGSAIRMIYGLTLVAACFGMAASGEELLKASMNVPMKGKHPMVERTVPSQSVTLPLDMEKSREWTARYFSSPAQLPVSFKVDGKMLTGIPDEWKPVSRKRRVDANIIETIFEGNDAKTGLNLRVECTEYLDYPVVEWVAWFTNKGNTPTPVISDILALDGTFTGAAPVLYHCNGDPFNDHLDSVGRFPAI